MADSGMEVGSVYATLGLDGTTFDAKMKGAHTALQGIRDDLANAGGAISDLGGLLTKGITVPILGVVGALFGASVSLTQYAQQLRNLSQTTGLSTDTLQRLRSVAKAQGLDWEALANTSTMVQRKLLGVENDSGMAADTMKRLGVSIHDSKGQLLSMDVLFPQLITKLQGMTNHTERNALAAQLFGRNMNEITPILGMSKAAMDAAMKSAGVMTEGQIAQAAKAAEAWNRLQMAIGGIARKLAVELLPLITTRLVPFVENTLIPAIKAIVEQFAAWIRKFEELPPAAQATLVIMGGLAAAAGPATSAVGNMTLQLGNMIMTMASLKTLGGLGGLFGTMGKSLGGIGGVIKGAVSGPVGWVTLAIAALGAAYVLLYNKSKPVHDAIANGWKQIRAAFIAAWSGIASPLAELRRSFVSVLAALKPLIKLFEGYWAFQFKAALGTIVLVMKLGGAAAAAAVQSVGWMISQVASGLKDFMVFVAKMLHAIGGLVPAAEQAAQAIKKALGGDEGHTLLEGNILMAMAVIKRSLDMQKERTKAAKAAAAEVAQAELDAIMAVVKAKRDAFEEARSQARAAMGFTGVTDLWHSAMVAGVRGTLGKVKESADLTRKDIPQTTELRAIREQLKKQEQAQKDLNALVRERLGVFA